MLEKFDLAKAALGFGERSIRAAEVPAESGEHLVPTAHFSDHGKTP
jgi:hypothetical protein